MISTTLDTYIDSQPFSIYYMTVSGHSGYYPNTAFVSEHLDKVLEVTGINIRVSQTIIYVIRWNWKKESMVIL